MGAIFDDAELRVETMQVDLTTQEGFDALDTRAASAANDALRHHWDHYAGVSLDEIADELTEDFSQESVSLPKSAFADPQEAGRELRIIRRTYRRMVLTWLGEIVRRRTFVQFVFPSGHEAPAQQPSQRTRRKQSQS